MEPRFTLTDNALGATFAKRFGNTSMVILQSTLPKATQDLMMLRVSQINGCGWCTDVHSKDLAAAGEPAVRINLVAAWREASVFSEAERAALALAEEGTRLADAHQGVSDETWAQVRKHYDDDQIAALLAGRWIATAESCTAGLVAARLTDIPGSSAYVAGGVVSYSNEAKSELLGVDPGLIETHGAVSEPVADAMADGALRRFSADTAVAITGIAGPGGGTEDKPVGTVCFCVKLADGTTDLRTMRLPGNRSDVRERSTAVAMHLLRRALTQSAAAVR